MSEEDLVAELRQIDREIARTQRLIREVPALVIMPQADEAVKRIRQTAATLAIPEAAVPPILARLAPGSRVSAPGLPRGLVIGGGLVEQSPAREVRLILTPEGEIKTVPVEELEEVPSSPSPPPTQTTDAGVVVRPLPQPSSPPQTTTGLRPGDKVTTPFGEGVIVSITPGGEAPFEVEIAGQSRFFLTPGDVKPAPTTTP